MSQSPVDEGDGRSALRYRQGWRALNRLLNEGRSFSGHEKHCAFLNCGVDAGAGGHRGFADISAATGFDFPDDGRGLAVVDWDFDGNLDVWVSNRTAPRLRLLRNEGGFGNHFVALLPEGDGAGTNRDAIGARVEVHPSGSAIPLIRTVQAGDGFLSQSSRWLHFGLGKNAEIERVVVRWPGNGGSTVFTGVEAGRFHRLDQATGSVVAWDPPSDDGGGARAVAAGGLEPRAGGDAARIVVPPGMRLPEIEFAGESEGAGVLAIDGPTVVNVWAAWCAPCVAELAEWGREADAIRTLGLEVIALHVDGAGEGGDPAEVVARSGFPFRWERVGVGAVDRLDALQCAVLDLWSPLPVPSTFLVDGDGEVVVIRKGRVGVAELAADAALLRATPDERRDAAVPAFQGGRWIDPPTADDPKRVAGQMLDRNDVAGAIGYLRALVAAESGRSSDPEARRDLGDACFFLGTLLEDRDVLGEAREVFEQARDLVPHDVRFRTGLARTAARLGDDEAALAEMRAAVAIAPDDPGLGESLAQALLRTGRPGEAVEVLADLVDRHPGRATARFHLAAALVETGQFREAIGHFRRTLTTDPRMFEAADRLARVLASHPDPAIRSGAEAVALAERLCRVTRERNPRYLETLAMASAEVGDFDRAVAAADQALVLLRELGNAGGTEAPPQLAEAITAAEARRDGFRNRTPYREPAWMGGE